MAVRSCVRPFTFFQSISVKLGISVDYLNCTLYQKLSPIRLPGRFMFHFKFVKSAIFKIIYFLAHISRATELNTDYEATGKFLKFYSPRCPHLIQILVSYEVPSRLKRQFDVPEVEAVTPHPPSGYFFSFQGLRTSLLCLPPT